MKEFRGGLQGRGLKIGLVVSRFNETVTENLLAGALETLTRAGVSQDDLTVVRVPGGFEIPLAARRLARSHKGNLDALICLGCVIRGETPHFDYIASSLTTGINRVMMEEDIPIAYGVLTTDSVEQAINRSGLKYGNKGEEAALTALEMANLSREIQ
ncbi:MAG TPA: 6,7-dimethyl-8-ribityllumazine synthase [Acidobacteriota bacterium]|nr:6,7-dimethyl-8-ribityllumazine synthase [Acidobacteriota bacterium]